MSDLPDTTEVTSLPLYEQHVGTLRVGGMTVPRKAAWRAFSLLEDHIANVEFMFIGASAGQQALKSIGILCELYDRKYGKDFVLVFRPMRYSTRIDGSGKLVDAQVWRCHVLDLSYLSQLVSAHAPKNNGS